MTTPEPLPPAKLRRRCDPNQFSFETTAEIADLEDSLGQDRAMQAMRVGVGVRRADHGLFALGAPGTGRHRAVLRFLRNRAQDEPVPSDWCYVHNFESRPNPRALRLPPGRGARFQKDMAGLVSELRATIPAAFEAEEYRSRKEAIGADSKERQESEFAKLQKKAQQKSLTIIRTPLGLAVAPVTDDDVLSPEQFNELPEATRKQITANMKEIQDDLQSFIRQIPQWERGQREREKELNREVTQLAVGHLIDELRSRYQDLPEVLTYLRQVQDDIVENTDAFLEDKEPKIMLPGLRPAPSEEHVALRRYQVNCIVDHAATKGAPVVYEDEPSHTRLVGRVEHTSQLGTLVTDFTLIRAGALHRANAGYLVLDARKVLMQPLAWESLKRALESREIKIESLGERLSLVSTVSLEPEPVPLDLKVVLIGEPLLYYLLSAYDPEFNELFKVPVDFDDRVSWDGDTAPLYARLIATLVRQDELRPLDREAVARVVEQAARVAGDTEKLSTHTSALGDVLREADYFASEAGRDLIAVADIERAIDTRIYCSDRIREYVQEAIRRGTILIDVTGKKVGQLNGLSVIQLGNFAFGRPSRITARVRLGKGEVVDIEREVELGGPIHSKGVLILAGFLGERYATEAPLALSASLVFEQSYSGVEGDSASSAELYALLSALAEVPLAQGIAVTGSVNQHGEVQAIGGATEKIEGFYDVCKEAGLTGDQGVLIPASNVQHLMLRQEVVDAVDSGKFQIWGVRTIDEGIELLTGVPAGEREPDGRYPTGTINGRVQDRLAEMARRVREFAKGERNE